jgi:hypothetical protein
MKDITLVLPTAALGQITKWADASGRQTAEGIRKLKAAPYSKGSQFGCSQK